MADISKTFKSVSEKDLQNAIMEYLGYNGWLRAHFRPAKTQAGNWITAMQGDTGYPDVTAVKGHRLVFAELKTEKGKITATQEQWLDALALAHREVYVVRPSTLNVFYAVLNGDLERGMEIHWHNQGGNDVEDR